MLYDPSKRINVPDNRPILTFDTSAINRVADDPDCEALIDGLGVGFHPRLTFTSVGEIIATANRDRRESLLRVCKRMLSVGDCIDPQHEIIRKMIEGFEADATLDWTEVYVRFPEAEQEIIRSETFDDELSKQEREEARQHDREFSQVYEGAKAPFDRLFASSSEMPPINLAQFIPHLQVPGGAFWILAARLCDRVSKASFDEAMVRRFVGQCEPFRALMLALFAAQYDRCIRPHGVAPSLRSGRNDTFMAVCLPFCHHFVSDDAGQLACFKAVASIAALDVSIHSYDEFLHAILVSKSVTMSAASKLLL